MSGETRPEARSRIPAVDLARGAALVAMAVYHFAWDLRLYGLIAVNVSEHPAWRLFAQSIAASFLALVGVSLMLAARGGIRPRPYLKRLAMIAGAAALVTIGTWYAFPDSFIFFGILHLIAVASVLGLAFLRAPPWLIAGAAIGAFAAPALLTSPAFDRPALWWLGLVPEPPPTNDYVPIFPWFGFVLTGMFAARLALARRWDARLAPWDPRGRPARILKAGGRHSLAVYLIHQPLLLGLLYLFTLVVPPDDTAAFREAYAASCVRRGDSAADCAAQARCTADRLRPTPLWDGIIANRLTPDELRTVNQIAASCRFQ